ncbi:TolC family protein [Sphingomonas sp. AX6]|uniref:TolC family protein n=1 Tax=Sphingomonas sp. AX6 TaxID=2653171 RepID=UPI0012F30354|nr:TolC family protein [Sphingomonas sp. AX6]VXC47409.1 exported hypothetical protein [Sphingomonas sp. AX6]
MRNIPHSPASFFALTMAASAMAAPVGVAAAPISAGGSMVAQDAGQPRASVPGPVTSSPSSPFGPTPPSESPLPPMPTTTGGLDDAAPVLPSIEGEALPLPERSVQDAAAPVAEPRQGPGSPSSLAAPLSQPLQISGIGDPVLELGRAGSSAQAFRLAVAAAVDRNPALGEAEAAAEEAKAIRGEAREGLFPSAELNVTSYNTISRAFSNDIDNIIERSRPRARTDAQLAVNQTLFDFGATFSRIAAGGARMRAAAAAIDDTASQIALRTIAAWYDIYTYRALLRISADYQTNQSRWQGEFAQRVDQGVNAQVDVARIDSSLASLNTRVARYERAVANAEAQFAQLTGQAAPAQLMRAPFLGDLPATQATARAAAIDVPAVRSASEQADAATRDAQALRRGVLPNISAGIDAGRYGVFETERDYDVRARITLSQRLGGGTTSRVKQATARATGASARARRVEEEAARDAAIAWSDLQALNRQTESLEQGYLSARQSRDAVEARFRISRGTLFDVINANDAYFGAAAAYIESLADRDAAHYVLLARTGRLLTALEIDSAYRQADQ